MTAASRKRNVFARHPLRTACACILASVASAAHGEAPVAAAGPGAPRLPVQVYVLERPAAPKHESLPPSHVEALRTLGATRIEDYGPFVYVSTGRMLEANRLEAAVGLPATVDPFAFLVDVGGRFRDVRDPWPPDGVEAGLRLADYPPGRTGLYVVKLAMPARASWFESAQKAGWRLLQYLHANAWIVAAPAGLEAVTGLAREAVYVEPLQPWDKLQAALRTDRRTERRPMTILFDGGQDGPELRGALREIDSESVVTIDNRGEGSVDLFATSADARLLARRPEVIGIQIRSAGGPSSEREAQVAVGHHAGNLPTNPGGYRSWLSGLCGGCLSPANLADEIVAIFDTGISQTTGAPGKIAHPDLDGGGSNRLAYPTTGCCGFEFSTTYDASYHGTAVTGLIAGDPQQAGGLGLTDPYGFYWGTGVAPGVRFGMTKMMTHQGFASSFSDSGIAREVKRVFDFGARYLNSSWNLAPDDPMTAPPDDPAYGYDAMARRLDILVRDARALDAASPPSENPMTIVVSVGNITASDNLDPSVRSPATAKNVIAVGASGLQVWDYVTAVPCRTGITIKDVSTLSRRGTALLGYGTAYIRRRPDLVAPGRSTASTRSYNGTRADCAYYDDEDEDLTPSVQYEGGKNYLAENGTSFAAPQVTGAAVLVKRFLENVRTGKPTPSPALLRAVLVGTAESMHGGYDYVYGRTLGFAPNLAQGYGRLSLAKLLSDSTAKVYEDQNENVLTFTGATKSFPLTVADPSKPIIVSLVYTDPPSGLLGSGYTVNQLAVNVQQGGAFYTSCGLGETQQYSARVTAPCGDAEGPADNTKQVRIAPNSFTGPFTVQVVARGINAKAVPSLSTVNQDFALFVYNAVSAP